MESPLGQLAHLQLEVDCGGANCIRNRRYLVSDFAGEIGRNTPMAQLIKRLRCRECQAPVIELTLLRKVGVRKPVTVRIPLIGPEARD